VELTCEQLGITKDDIAERVADKIASHFIERAEMVSLDPEDGGGETSVAVPTKFADEIEAAVQQRIEDAIDTVLKAALQKKGGKKKA